jgi:phosphoribosylaminoimidazole-succinocarboxamide synthase
MNIRILKKYMIWTFPKDLKLSSKLPEPIFTPTTKEVSGHDISITIKRQKAYSDQK